MAVLFKMTKKIIKLELKSNKKTNYFIVRLVDCFTIFFLFSQNEILSTILPILICNDMGHYDLLHFIEYGDVATSHS